MFGEKPPLVKRLALDLSRVTNNQLQETVNTMRSNLMNKSQISFVNDVKKNANTYMKKQESFRNGSPQKLDISISCTSDINMYQSKVNFNEEI